MDTRRSRPVHGGELPDLLTVEEAAEILRLGRTKAYALAHQWRVSGGTAGLPVLDFGNVLRVPRHALEQLVGAELHAPAVVRRVDPDEPAEPAPTSQQRALTTSTPRPAPASQLDLFDPPDAS